MLETVMQSHDLPFTYQEYELLAIEQKYDTIFKDIISEIKTCRDGDLKIISRNEMKIVSNLMKIEEYKKLQRDASARVSENALLVPTVAKVVNRTKGCYSGDYVPKGVGMRKGDREVVYFRYDGTGTFTDVVTKFIVEQYTYILYKEWQRQRDEPSHIHIAPDALTNNPYREIRIDPDYMKLFSEYFANYCEYVKEHTAIMLQDDPESSINRILLRNRIENEGYNMWKFNGYQWVWLGFVVLLMWVVLTR